MNPIGSHRANNPGFACNYLDRYSSGLDWELPKPDPDLFLSVVIPSFKEPEIIISLDSLLSCDPPGISWEILIVINYPAGSSPEVVEISRKTCEQIRSSQQDLHRSDVSVHFLWCPDLPVKRAGVGLARKIGMDEAVRRFNTIGRSEGLIASFDADSTCDPGYLKEIASFFATSRARAANIYFEHSLEGSFKPENYQAIAEYELYLRYFRLAVERTGHPHAIHTVGSSFCIRASTYVRVNGMGSHQAGEDFYFLHKCVQQGRFYEINTSTVYPSSRESDRVIFGTGATVRKQAGSEGMLQVYSLDAFAWFTGLYARLEKFYHQMDAGSGLFDYSSDMPEEVGNFKKKTRLEEKMIELYRVTSSYPAFRKRFFSWFDVLMILRYLNELHPGVYPKSPVMGEASALARIAGIPVGATCREMLMNYREFEKSRGIRRVT